QHSGSDDLRTYHASRKDYLRPSPEVEKRKHKTLLVQSPDPYFIDVKCPKCCKMTTVSNHAQTVILCVGCSSVLCQPTGRKARFIEGSSFRRKQHQTPGSKMSRKPFHT
ncbi:small ribosomal subunit protein eS27-like, partial [Cavia porcellus]|uniref:small ribosomal subunit protein eS27-like n=1 Tax=Cavia porcellus TaxID=10141 RepID=UPI000661A45C